MKNNLCIFLVAPSWALGVLSVPASARQEDERVDPQARIVTRLTPSGYNRAEGLGFMVGPAGTTGGQNPFRAEALFVLRTEPAFGVSTVGYSAQIQKTFFSGKLNVGGTGYSEIRPIDSQGIPMVENSITALLLRGDYRDYESIEGFRFYAAYGPIRGTWSAAAALQTDLSHSIGFAQASSGVGNNYSKWRLHPIAAAGRSYSLNLSGRYTSNTRRRTDPLPAPGVTARGQLIFGLGGTFSYPTDLESETGTAIMLPTPSSEFVAGRLDAKGVLAISDARLQARVLLGGAITDVRLPNGYQTSLGGRGSAPGLDPLPVGKQTASPPGGSSRLDCGARENFYISPSARQSYYPFHGCDRFALFQIQIEGYVGLRFGPDDLALNDPMLGLMIEPVPRWIVFADAAQGWALGNSGTVLRRDEAMAYDVGAGIAFGDLGLFVAKPFSDRGDGGARFIIRLGNRI